MNPETPQPIAPQSQPANAPVTEQPVSSGTQSGTQPQAQPPVSNSPNPKIPFYRSYWTFAAIFLILPSIVGLVILLTGDIYRKHKDGTAQPVKKREKVTLVVLSLLLWAFILFGLAGSFSKGYSMTKWFNTNRTAYNQYIDSTNNDMQKLLADNPSSQISNPTLIEQDCSQLQSDIDKANKLPAMPDKTANGFWSDAKNSLSQVAASCLTAVHSNSSFPASINDSIDQASSAQTKLEAQLKLDGLTP